MAPLPQRQVYKSVRAQIHGMEPLLLQGLLSFGIASGLFYMFFHRDPERMPPKEDGIILSPADGWIKCVKHIKPGEVPVVEKYGREIELVDLQHMGILKEGQGGFLMSVYMSLMDVHVNRSPVSGTVENIQYRPGKLKLLVGRTFQAENERNTLVLQNEDTDMKVGVVQIASPFVRKIDCYVADGDLVELGQRIGMIRLGSQVDLILPDKEGLEIMARKGMRVRAGTSILARLRR